MNSFGILFWDEMRGFMKSKVMIALWIGLPIISILMHLYYPSYAFDVIPTSYYVALMISSVGGLLAVVTLSVQMVNEIGAKVYDLYLIRPVKRWHIIVTKYLAVFLSITVATLISVGIGMIIDVIKITDYSLNDFFIEVIKSIAISTAGISICCASGILIGMLLKSVALAAILSIYLGQQLSMVVLLPAVLLDFVSPNGSLFFTLGVGIGLTIAIMGVGIIVFNKKQF